MGEPARPSVGLASEERASRSHSSSEMGGKDF